MTEAPASREAFELAFQDYLVESRRERASQFRPDMLAWLALPPQWTSRLAQQAGFPRLGSRIPGRGGERGPVR